MSQQAPASSAAMNEQQELYKWLKTEYNELFKLQESIKTTEANAQKKPGGITAADKEVQTKYQTRFAAYQMKLGEYHKCQKSILESSNSSSSSSQKQQQGANGAQQQQKISGTAATGVKQKIKAGEKKSADPMTSTANTTFDPYTRGSKERQHQLSSVTTKFRASDLKGMEIKTGDGVDDYSAKGEYIFSYEEIRGSLLKRCMELGMEQRRGMTLWNEYWNGLRKFLLYRISKTEFEVLMLDELKLPSDVLSLHNCLLGSILSNARSGVTAKENVSLLPYLCTGDEIQEFSDSSNNVAEQKPATGGVDATERAFLPLVTRDCLEGGVVMNNKPASADGAGEAGPGTKKRSSGVVQIVNRIHGSVLAARPLLKPPPVVQTQQVAVKGVKKGGSAPAKSTAVTASSDSGKSSVQPSSGNSNSGDKAIRAKDSKESGHAAGAAPTSEARPGMRRSRDSLVSLESGGGGSSAKVARTSANTSGDDAEARGVSGTRSGLRLAAGAEAEPSRPRRSTR